ncbi:hypothetical protein N7445_002316 [Penicillium cf. griseofulvum]|nr:hypothetical protein N7445_002316 [Penicillium cf. griseofulvum]
MREGLWASLNTIRDAAAFAEGLLLVDRCIETMKDDTMKPEVEGSHRQLDAAAATAAAPTTAWTGFRGFLICRRRLIGIGSSLTPPALFCNTPGMSL